MSTETKCHKPAGVPCRRHPNKDGVTTATSWDSFVETKKATVSQSSIDEMNYYAALDRATEFLKTEMGAEFDKNSLDISKDAKTFTLSAVGTFAIRGITYEPKEKVTFSSSTLAIIHTPYRSREGVVKAAVAKAVSTQDERRRIIAEMSERSRKANSAALLAESTTPGALTPTHRRYESVAAATKDLRSGDIISTGERVIKVERGISTPKGKTEVILEHADGKYRRSLWGSYTNLNVSRPIPESKIA